MRLLVAKILIVMILMMSYVGMAYVFNNHVLSLAIVLSLALQMSVTEN